MKKKIETYEEWKRKQSQYIHDSKFIPEPSYLWSVGDSVTVGNLKDAVIHASFNGGVFYEIDFTDVENNYGNPIRTPHQKRFFYWTSIRPTVTENHNVIVNDDLFLQYTQRTIDGLFSIVYHFGLELNPEYQRGYVWNESDEESLIDSIFNNVDIGKFVFVQNDFGGEYLYEILDGKQRIKALTRFYENKFSYRGFRYNDLSIRERNHFDDYSVAFAEIREPTQEQKLRQFLRLNQHGKIMDKKHLEDVQKMLDELEK